MYMSGVESMAQFDREYTGWSRHIVSSMAAKEENVEGEVKVGV